MRIIVTDANVLINLLHVHRLDLLGRIPAHEFVVPDHVREEITAPGSRERLDDAIHRGTVKLELLEDLDAISMFVALIRHIGRGGAACIALAAQHGWSIASDEKRRFRREAARLGRLGSSERPIYSCSRSVRGFSRSKTRTRTSAFSNSIGSRWRSRRFATS